MQPYLPVAPKEIVGYNYDMYADLVVNWAAVHKDGRDITVTLCSTCASHRGVGNAPKFAAVNGTWVGEVPECLQGLTLAEEIIIGLVFMRGLVIFLSGKGPQSGRQRGFTGHVISYPLDAGSTMSALTTLPRTTHTLADSMAVVYYRKAANKAELVQRYSSSLEKLAYVRRSRVRGAITWLMEHNPLYK
jgi:hypothetical protein